MNNYFKSIAILTFLVALTSVVISCTHSPTKTDGWEKIDVVLDRIIPPIFPDKEFNIKVYGAVGDGITDCTNSIKLAIDDCVKNGGGKVLVPKGVYLTGAIRLKSNVNLYLADSAALIFSDDKSKYLPLVYSRWEGVECMNYSSLIYAFGEENIAITGTGILDGQGSNSNWWSWKGIEKYGWQDGMPNQKIGRDKLFEMGEKDIPVEHRVLGDGYYLRPNFVQFYKSKNILIEGVSFKDSPMWFINPVLCQNVSLIGVNIEGLGPNNDGFDPESSKDVLIENCFFNNGDDCIAIKSGRNNDGRRINIPSENIIIKNCEMKNGHGGVVLGSEISGGANNIFIEDCVMDSPELDRAIRIKTNSVRGGKIENIFVRNLTIGEVKEAILKINFYYEEGDAGKFTPSVNNIVLENIISKKSSYALWIKAYEHSKVKNLVIRNSRFENVGNNNLLENVESISFEDVTINNKVIN
ncbi:MAG: glycoside hydrolase family 28 protein [Ignavibacteriales bacterium]|nr:glycoside hydrolase family 28 protein [Ignavibacteriales bacterium]